MAPSLPSLPPADLHLFTPGPLHAPSYVESAAGATAGRVQAGGRGWEHVLWGSALRRQEWPRKEPRVGWGTSELATQPGRALQVMGEHRAERQGPGESPVARQAGLGLQARATDCLPRALPRPLRNSATCGQNLVGLSSPVYLPSHPQSG